MTPYHGQNSSSLPDLSKVEALESDSRNTYMRKRKVPNDDLGQQFTEFEEDVIGLLKEFGKYQDVGISLIKNDISLIKKLLVEIKTTIQHLVKENSYLKTQVVNFTDIVGYVQKQITKLKEEIHTLKK
ncbi:unnamed protein product [Chilo suppressalis]|uniref:Uncharacterized protein n=1 Tax=Chilo suppressalis TaxID=168631 RepID=A0ABN8B9T0_CHISP|nr:unnamed protein product [Chilo suppressalis]